MPFHGHFYRILTAQGPDAPGGAMSYIVDGKMTKGFIVNLNGVVYEKDIGPPLTWRKP